MHITQTLTLVGYRAISDALGKMAFFVILILAARRLPQSAFGLIALGTTVGWIAAVISDCGIGTHLAREIARHPGMRQGLLREWFTLRVAIGMLVLTVATCVLLLVPMAAGSRVTLGLLILTYAVGGTLESLNGYFRGLSRTDLESSLTLIQRAGQLTGASLVLVWRPDPAMLALSLLFPAILALGLGLRFATRLAALTHVERRTLNEERSTPNDERSTQNVERSTTRIFVGDVAPIGIGIILSALYFRLDVLLLEWWQGLEAVAQYNAVFRLIEGLRLFPAAVLAVALPTLVRAATKGPVTRLAAGLTAMSILVAAVLAIGADWLVVTAYGPAYAAAVPAFRVLLLGFPLMSLNYALTTQLVAWNGQRAFAGLCALALAFNVIVNARVIPSLSILGAAWTTVATEAVLTLGCVAALAVRASFIRSAPRAALLES